MLGEVEGAAPRRGRRAAAVDSPETFRASRTFGIPGVERGMADHNSRTAAARYATPEILDFVHRVHAPHDGGLARAFEAPEREGMPAIQVGASEGKLLGLLLRLAGATKVVEVGT